MSGTVTAELGYLGDPYKVDDGQRLHYYADFTRTSNVILNRQAVRIEDARPNQEKFSLDREGFTLVRWPTDITDFMDTRAVEPEYIAECAELIRQLTGAVETCSSGPIHCRFDNFNDPMARYDGRPAHYIHDDYSENCGVATVAQQLGEIAKTGRTAIYNLWRVLTPPPQSMPLAVCDASSIDLVDEVESHVILSYPDGREVDSYTNLIKPNPKHRWYYFSDMTADEVLVFKSYDSDPSRASRVPHCAFVDSSVAQGSARVSIESRITAGFSAN